ncbi:DNA-directed RNA polymerase [Amylostereum chailletii]|nr:DNA-directed RNA polymerase [Amylostereum chailletii]
MSSSTHFDPRKHVGVRAERVTNVSSTDFPGYHPGEDHSWSLDSFKERLRVSVKRLSNRSIEFDLVGVDASIANAIRRILIAEVPTVAIEYVYVWNNNSVMVDEVFSHRLGLIPLNVDPALVQMRDPSTQNVLTDRDTLVFKLNVVCTRRKTPRDPSAPKSAAFPVGADEDLYEHSTVRSGDLVWEPVGEQESIFPVPPAPTNPDIVLVKLRPGQEINMEMHALKGVAKDHAKFSAVATASYRILPQIFIKKPIPPHLAEKFQKCFSPGVIRVDPRTKKVSVDSENLRKDSVSREVLRHPEFEGCVELARVRDHFIFSIESESAYEPKRLPFEAISIMRDKILTLRRAAEGLLVPEGADEDVEMHTS